MRKHSFLAAALLGRDVYLGAWILLPDAFDQHPDARFPLVVYQDHFHPGFGPQPFVTGVTGRFRTDGPAEYTMQENNGTWTQRVLPEMVKHMLATAPKGADTTSWQY